MQDRKFPRRPDRWRREEPLSWIVSPGPAGPPDRAGNPARVDEDNLHRHLLEQLVHLEVTEDEARGHWTAVSARRLDLQRRLGRDPGIRVAALDYLLNERRILLRPVAVEESRLEQAENGAAEDGLTGLFNTRRYLAALRSEVRRAQRRLQQFTVVWLEVDSWSDLRAAHGPSVADAILRKLAGVLQARLRDMDLAARIEESRFALLLPLTRRSGAFVASDRIRGAARDLFRRPGIVVPGRIPLALSGGIAEFPDDGDTGNLLLRRARQAAGRARESGGDRIVPFYEDRRGGIRLSPAGSPLRAVVLRDSGVAGRVRVRELGEGGALLEGDARLQAGEVITLRFEQDGTEAVLEISARVERWAPPGPDAGPARGGGVSFLLADPLRVEALRNLLGRIRREGVE